MCIDSARLTGPAKAMLARAARDEIRSVTFIVWELMNELERRAMALQEMIYKSEKDEILGISSVVDEMM